MSHHNKDSVSTQGLKNQAELYRWIAAAVTEPGEQSIPTGSGELHRRLYDSKKGLREAYANGWRLTITKDGSPADKAGSDFIWENARGDWWPLDCTARVKHDKPQLITLLLVQNALVQDGRGLTLDCKIACAEVLINLTKTPAVLNRTFLQPPQTEPVADLRQALTNFQNALISLKSRANGELFEEWARNLKKAIGRQLSREQTSTSVTKNWIQSTIREAVDCFIAGEVRGERSVPQRSFGRQKGISYRQEIDTLLTGDDSLPQVTNLSKMIIGQFDASYHALIKSQGLSEKMIRTKRSFAATGLTLVLHLLLDNLEQKKIASTEENKAKHRRERVARSIGEELFKSMH